MVGQAPWVGEGLVDSMPEVRIWAADGAWPLSWQTLRPGFGQDSTKFGMEMTLAATLRAYAPLDTFYLVKTAWSGTALDSEWLPPSRQGPGVLWSAMVNGVGSALAALPGPPTPIDGFFWMQGENDALVRTQADAYHDNLKALVGDLRSIWQDSTIPFVVGLVPAIPTWVFGSTVRDAQVLVSMELEGIDTVETTDLETDGIHYTAAGLKEFGFCMARKWLSMRGSESSTSVGPPRSRCIRRTRGCCVLRISPDGTPAMYRRIGTDGRGIGSWTSGAGEVELSRRDRSASGIDLVQIRHADGWTETLKIPSLR